MPHSVVLEAASFSLKRPADIGMLSLSLSLSLCLSFRLWNLASNKSLWNATL